MLRKSLILLAGLTAISGPAIAGPVPGFPLSQGGVRPANVYESERRSGGLQTEYLFRRDWFEVRQSYEAALQFAQCVDRLNPDAASTLLRTPNGAQSREDMVRLARMNRGCVIQNSALAPVLLRAALAETLVRRSGARRLEDASQLAPVGMPDSVDGYPLAAISRCQVSAAPELVANVLSTDPGSNSEKAAVETLFARSPDCGAPHPGRLTPTAARLALVDAAFLWAR